MRAISKLNKGDFINIPADAIDFKDGWVCAYSEGLLVAIAKAELVDSCHLSEKESANNGRK